MLVSKTSPRTAFPAVTERRVGECGEDCLFYCSILNSKKPRLMGGCAASSQKTRDLRNQLNLSFDYSYEDVRF